MMGPRGEAGVRAEANENLNALGDGGKVVHDERVLSRRRLDHRPIRRRQSHQFPGARSASSGLRPRAPGVRFNPVTIARRLCCIALQAVLLTMCVIGSGYPCDSTNLARAS